MMKRTILLLTVTIFMATILSGCGGSPGGGTTKQSTKGETTAAKQKTATEPKTVVEITKSVTVESPSEQQPAASESAGVPRAICKDGTTSYSQNRSGTCSHHGGVAKWLY